MKTLLVLANHSGLPEAIRAVLDPERYRVIHHREVWAAEPLFSGALYDACLVDTDLTDVRPLRLLEQLRKAAPKCPIFVFSSARQWEWEEEAYVLGVEQVLAKPIRAPLLNALLERCWARQVPPPTPPPVKQREPETKSAPAVWGTSRTLEVFRSFSGILTHSLQTESLLKQFLLLLREVISVNRAAIFLRQPSNTLTAGLRGHRLYAACAIGLPPALAEHFALSLNAGIGKFALAQGRILRSGSEEARADGEIQHEFEVLGVQVAIPILDRESLVGVAVFDGRLTGEFFASEELALIFHLLEGLGLAIRNSWLHDEMQSNHRMMADVLDHLGSGCVAVAGDLEILHANKTARAYFRRETKTGSPLEFSELPPVIASKVYEAVQTGVAPAAFKYSPPDQPESIYRISIAPFNQSNERAPRGAMLLMEDFTQLERAHEVEIEAANGRLLKSMAERLAHEIGNSLVPISTYQQLGALEANGNGVDPSVISSSADGIRRIGRLSNQMRFLARDQCKDLHEIPLNKLVEEAFKEALSTHTNRACRLQFESTLSSTATVRGDYAGLKLALSEVLLNALQSSPADNPVELHAFSETDSSGKRRLGLEIRDAGQGFSAELASQAAEPFYSKRMVGLGLGLTVARKIIEIHHGKLEIVRNQVEEAGIVRIYLPLEGQ